MNSVWVTVDAPVGGKREADLRVQLKENPVRRALSSSSLPSGPAFRLNPLRRAKFVVAEREPGFELYFA